MEPVPFAKISCYGAGYLDCRRFHSSMTRRALALAVALAAPAAAVASRAAQSPRSIWSGAGFRASAATRRDNARVCECSGTLYMTAATGIYRIRTLVGK